MKIYAFADEADNMIDGQIEAMKTTGIDGLEVRGVDNVNISDISIAKAREVKKKMDGAGLKVWSIGSPIGKIDIVKGSFETEVERLRRTLETAAVLGAENIRLFSFYFPKDANKADYKNEVIDRLGIFLEHAKGTGITLCHENEKGIYGDVPERCLEIHKALPEMKAIFDPANYIQCGVNTLAAWETIKPYVKYMHIKDALADGNVVPAGKGVGELPTILADYISRGGNAVTIEPHLTVFKGLEGLEMEGERSVVGEVYKYPTKEAAFEAAVSAFKNILVGE